MNISIMNRFKVEEKHLVIISIPLIFLGLILALASFVYSSNIAIAIRRNNIGGANYYREVSSQMFSEALILFGIATILLGIAYYISTKR